MNSIYLKRNTFLLTVFFLSLTAAAFGQTSSDESPFHAWDKDHNQKLTHAEFYRGISMMSIFESWDQNSDDILDRQEIYGGGARMQNRAGRKAILHQAGIGVGSNAPSGEIAGEEGEWMHKEEAGELLSSFKEMDLNRNGTLDRTEFFTALFRLLDKDENGFLRSHELREAALEEWTL